MDEVQFPSNISYGSSGGPGFYTNVITVDSGQEERVSRWQSARSRYDVVNGVKNQEDLYALITFYRARMGAANAFRYKDWADYATTPDGTNYGPSANTVLATAETIGVGDGAETEFQLIKTYTSGGVTRTRRLTKPVAGTVKVAKDGVTASSGWSVDTTTGVVLFTTAPGVGVVVTAGCEFDVPVRFGEEVDKQLPIRLEDYRNGSVSVPLVEVADETTCPEEFFYGGAKELASTADVSISGSTRVWILDLSGAAANAFLPATTDYPAGGPWFYILNDGTNTITLKSHGGSTICTIAVGKGVQVLLTKDGSGTKIWYAL